MNFKFWKRGDSDNTGQKSKLPRPRELPDRVGIYLVTHLKEDPDWVWSMKAVTRPRENDRHIHDIRIYDPREARQNQIEVENFNSLEGHLNLILFSGCYNKDTGTVELEKTSQAAA